MRHATRRRSAAGEGASPVLAAAPGDPARGAPTGKRAAGLPRIGERPLAHVVARGVWYADITIASVLAPRKHLASTMAAGLKINRHARARRDVCSCADTA